LLAESRSLACVYERLLTRKLLLNFDESAARDDPIQTVKY